MRLLRLAVVLAAVLTATPSAQAPLVDGTWRAEFVHDPANRQSLYPFPFVVLRLQVRDNALTGTVEFGTLLPAGTPISNARLDGDRFTIEAVGKSDQWRDPETRERRCCPKWIMSGRITGDVMELSWVETMTGLQPNGLGSTPTPMKARRISTDPNAK